MLNFSQGYRSFKEGLNWRLIRDYSKAVREHGWEILCCAGPVGIAFGILTLYYTPSRSLLGLLFGWIVLVAGYYVWRADHLRLMPKLGIGDVNMIYAGAGVPDKKRRFVQILIECTTEGPIENCRGQLLRILKLSDGKWEPTHIDEPLDLLWSFVDEPILTLEHGAPRRLNVFIVENTSRTIVPWTRIKPKLPSAPSDIFRFDVRVAGDDCPAKYIPLKVTFGDQWNDLYPEIIGNET